MTKENKTIKAVEILIEWYKEHSIKMSSCPLCIIHRFNSCRGCPNQTSNEFLDCVIMHTYRQLVTWDKEGTSDSRLEFWEKALPYLRTTPSEYFTCKCDPRQQKDQFMFLKKLDEQIYNKQLKQKS